MANNDYSKIIKWGGIFAAIAAILAVVDPAATWYIETKVEAFDKAEKAKEPSKEKFRHLLGGKMGIADDEVHIEMGKDHKRIKSLQHQIDSLTKLIDPSSRKFDKAVVREFKYYHQGTILGNFEFE